MKKFIKSLFLFHIMLMTTSSCFGGLVQNLIQKLKIGDISQARPALNAIIKQQKENPGSLDINEQGKDSGQTALHHAATLGEAGIVRLLVHIGANVNARCSSGNSTPLHSAALNGHKEVAESLLAEGADVNAVDIHRTTPLHNSMMSFFQSQKRSIDMLELLLAQEDINVNVRNNSGETPLHYAIRYGNIEIA